MSLGKFRDSQFSFAAGLLSSEIKEGKNMIQTKQTNLNIFYNFSISDSFETTTESLTTSTRATNFTRNPFYSCRTRRGYSPYSDPFNEWRRQKEPADYSRQDIAISYRLGGGF
jgi:hypothetical protein